MHIRIGGITIVYKRSQVLTDMRSASTDISIYSAKHKARAMIAILCGKHNLSYKQDHYALPSVCAYQSGV